MQQEIINFTDPLDFVYDTNSVKIDENGATLKELIPNASFVQSFKDGANADYPSTADLVPLSNNGITGIGSNGYAEFSGTNKNITYSIGSATPLQKGTIRYKYMPLYSGTPSERQYLINDNNKITIQHTFTGNLSIEVQVATGESVEILLNNWNPTSGTLYEIELNYDLVQGEIRAFLDGVQIEDTKTLTGNFFPFLNFTLGAVQEQNWRCYGFAIIEGVSHELDYSNFQEILDTIYTKERQRIEVNSPIITNGITSVEIVDIDPASADVKYLANVSGVDYAYNIGSQEWRIATSLGQGSTRSIFQNNISTLDLSGGRVVKIIPALRSANGTAIPTVNKITVDYGFNLPTDFKVSTCVVYGYVFDHSGLPVEGARIEVDGTDFFFSKPVSADNTRPTLVTRSVEIFTDSDGRWGIPIVETVTDGTDVTFTISYNNANGKRIKNVFKNVVIPNQLVAALGDLV